MPVKLNLDDFKKEISLTKKKEENLVDLKDFEYISYTNNHEVDDFLNEKSFMLINFIGKCHTHFQSGCTIFIPTNKVHMI